MPRPSLADVRRPQILEAYARCLIRYGPGGTTLDRIAEEAGVTRALVRHYLGNRKDVDGALVAHLRGRYVEWLDELGRGLPPAERLPRILDAMFAPTSEEPSQLVDALLGISTEDPVLQGLLREMYLELEHLLHAEIASARPAAPPEAQRRVAYGILCLAGMHRTLADLGFPADRGPAARVCAERLLATLDA
jgi:AcrR family transcriptional regulator